MQHPQRAEPMENSTSSSAGKTPFYLSIDKFKYSSLCSTIWERICSKSHQLQTIFPSFGWHTQRQSRPDIPGKQRGWAGWDLPEVNPNQTKQRIPSPWGSQLCPSSSLCLCQGHAGTAIHTQHNSRHQLCPKFHFLLQAGLDWQQQDAPIHSQTHLEKIPTVSAVSLLIRINQNH